MKLNNSCSMAEILTNSRESHHPFETLLFALGFGKLIAQLVAPLKVVKQHQAILQFFIQLKTFDLVEAEVALVVVDTSI